MTNVLFHGLSPLGEAVLIRDGCIAAKTFVAGGSKQFTMPPSAYREWENGKYDLFFAHSMGKDTFREGTLVSNYTAMVATRNKDQAMPSIDWLERCASKYYDLTGKSPQCSFYTFLDACGIAPSQEGMAQFYNEMAEWLTKG